MGIVVELWNCGIVGAMMLPVGSQRWSVCSDPRTMDRGNFKNQESRQLIIDLFDASVINTYDYVEHVSKNPPFPHGIPAEPTAQPFNAPRSSLE